MYLETQSTGNPVILTNVSMDTITEIAKQHWLSYWKYFQRTPAEKCAEQGCTHKHQHGVLVQTNHNNKLFVVPVCAEHGLAPTITLNREQQVDVISAELTL